MSMAMQSCRDIITLVNTKILFGPSIRTVRCGKSNKKKGRRKALDMKTVFPNLVNMQYAILGPLTIRSVALRKELNAGVKKPFKMVINANIGDAQAMEQMPITFIRQVIACAAYTGLLDTDLFPSDVKERAQDLLCGCSGHSMGAYTQPCGIELVRRHVAEYIERRDCHPANWQNICLTAGTTGGIKLCLQLLCGNIGGKPSGVMIPIPQYPLYSAALSEYGLGQVKYFLDEDNNWGLGMAELERAYEEGKAKYNIRTLVVINPGNPTGQVLTKANMVDVVKFAHKYTLIVMADEVYQDNIYDKDSTFLSFKKVITEMDPPYNEVELVSFMSISKGYMCECGLRGGWMELLNIDPGVHGILNKTVSVLLCPSSLGQVAVDCIARTPIPGEPSYDLWCKEKTATLESLNQRSKMIVKAFQSMEGFKCNTVQGAMYAFPRINLSPKAVEAAKAAKLPPDAFYAHRLLEQTGICIVPGSGFGQRPGTYHFRTTILPQLDALKEMLNVFKVFHAQFTKEYA